MSDIPNLVLATRRMGALFQRLSEERPSSIKLSYFTAINRYHNYLVDFSTFLEGSSAAFTQVSAVSGTELQRRAQLVSAAATAIQEQVPRLEHLALTGEWRLMLGQAYALMTGSPFQDVRAVGPLPGHPAPPDDPPPPPPDED